MYKSIFIQLYRYLSNELMFESSKSFCKTNKEIYVFFRFRFKEIAVLVY